MTLQEKLDEIRSKSKIRVSEDNRAIMRGATETLARSGRLDRTPGAGQTAPDFALADSTGVRYDSRTLRGEGPLLLVFFRGHW